VQGGCESSEWRSFQASDVEVSANRRFLRRAVWALVSHAHASIMFRRLCASHTILLKRKAFSDQPRKASGPGLRQRLIRRVERALDLARKPPPFLARGALAVLLRREPLIQNRPCPL
jgi:hypothetical protein